MANPQTREQLNGKGKQLANQSRNAMNEAKQDAEDLIASPTETLKATATTVIDAVEKVAEQFKSGSTEATKFAQEYSGTLIRYAKKHPYRIAISVGAIGLLLGLFFRGRKAE